MNMYDVITKTKRKISLTSDEINYLVGGYVNGEIPDYQVSAWLMAVCLNSLTDRETSDLTVAMRDSGKVFDLSKIDGITVDKHSTGGVGDKTSLIIAPIVASCGGYVPKMSGRGLGHTGGTIDKLESIEGFSTSITFDRFIEIVNSAGFSIISQADEIVPADKKLYALRDLTATVDSIPLICSSIMSKKLATGSHNILLDVKVGKGAFMKNLNEAKDLARLMVSTAKSEGRNCRAILTNMDFPLGRAVGNSLEVIEAVEILKGKDKGVLYQLCIELSANMLELCGKGNLDECRALAEGAISSGKALDKFATMIEMHGGNRGIIEDYSKLPTSKKQYSVVVKGEGYVSEIDSEEIGICSLLLGAGRRVKGDAIDLSAGIIIEKTIGEKILSGESVATLHTSRDVDFELIAGRVASAFKISDREVQSKIILDEIIY